jgi:hypothetical protein
MQRKLLVALVAGAAIAAVAFAARSRIEPEANGAATRALAASSAARETTKANAEHRAPARLRSFADVDTR